MGRFMFYSVQFCFLVYLVTLTYAQADNSRGPKRTKSPYASIIPFLRTGRSRLQVPFSEESGDENYKRASKPGRATIMAFPRVGRAGTMEWDREEGWSAQKKSGSPNMNNGLWFGPRLGRIHKRQEYKQDIPFGYLYIGDYTPRLGRESEETLDDGTALADDQENDKTVVEAV